MVLDKEKGVGKAWHEMKPLVITHMMFCVIGALGKIEGVVNGLVLLYSCVIMISVLDSMVLLANNKKRVGSKVLFTSGKAQMDLASKLEGNLYICIRLTLGVLGLIFFYFSVDNRIKDMLGGGDLYYLFKIIIILGGVVSFFGEVV